jgi:hypothetical protein
VSVARVLIWNLADSKTTLDEVRAQLPPLPEDGFWILNEPQERFGVISRAELPDLTRLQELIGKDPDIAEEFDAVD